MVGQLLPSSHRHEAHGFFQKPAASTRIGGSVPYVLLVVLCLATGKGEATGSEPVARSGVSPIDWGQTETFPRIVETDLPEGLILWLDEVALPVLLPDRRELLVTAIPTSGDGWYAVSIPVDGLTIYLRGSIRSFAISDIDLHRAILTCGYFLTRNQHIASLSFTAFGAGYLIEVECADPLGDPRCTQDGFILTLAESLVLAGGVQ